MNFIPNIFFDTVNTRKNKRQNIF